MISVVLATYNSGAKLKQSIDSILNQTYCEFELIVIDDGSTDDSVECLKSFSDQRIKIWQNKKNIGLTASLIKGVSGAHGKYIARIDAGDCWAPNKLESQVKFLNLYPDYILCGTQVEYVSANQEVVGKSWFSVDDIDLKKKMLRRQGVFEHSSIMFRNVINYRDFFKYSQDLDLYVRASFKGKLHCIDQYLTKCDINETGITIKKKYLQRQYQKICYDNFISLNDRKKDLLEERTSKILIRDTWLDRSLNRLSMPFFLKYVQLRSAKRSSLLWGSYLFLSLVAYPPYLIDYFYKLMNSIKK